MYDLLFDQETIMENHVASETRKAEARATDLINYLWSHGRGEEAMKASSDASFLQKLLSEYTGLTPAT